MQAHEIEELLKRAEELITQAATTLEAYPPAPSAIQARRWEIQCARIAAQAQSALATAVKLRAQSDAEWLGKVFGLEMRMRELDQRNQPM